MTISQRTAWKQNLPCLHACLTLFVNVSYHEPLFSLLHFDPAARLGLPNTSASPVLSSPLSVTRISFVFFSLFLFRLSYLSLAWFQEGGDRKPRAERRRLRAVLLIVHPVVGCTEVSTLGVAILLLLLCVLCVFRLSSKRGRCLATHAGPSKTPLMPQRDMYSHAKSVVAPTAFGSGA